jgi:hypothetical protein
MVMNQPRAKVKASRYLSADASGRGKSKGKDEGLLKLVQNYFAFARWVALCNQRGVGSIYSSGSRASLAYKVSSVKDLVSVIKHFDKYPLITFKLADYLLFKEVVGMIKLKEHLTKDGLDKIVAIKA